MRSPIQWLGGKSLMVTKWRKYVTIPHTTYVEVFGGGGSMLFGKDPEGIVEVYNDLDGRLVNFFRVLRDPDLFAVFQRRVESAPLAKLDYATAACLCRCPAADQVTQAAAFFTLARQSFGGMAGKAWGTAVASLAAGQARTVAEWMNVINRLPEVSARLRRVQIDNADFRQVINHYDRPETLFYLDPPYVASTRRGGGYECELTDDDHRNLLSMIKHAQGMVMISGYPSALYDKTLARWRCDKYETKVMTQGCTKTQNNKGKGGMQDKRYDRIEAVWFNPKMARRLKTAGIHRDCAPERSACSDDCQRTSA